MAEGLGIDIKRLKIADFAAFGEDQAAIGNLISNAIAEAYAKYVREHYLSGQVLPIRTGETIKSVKFIKWTRKYPKGGAFFVRPGIGIRGMLNYLAGPLFERGPRPVIGPSFAAFKATGEHRTIALRIYNAMARKKLGR